MGTLVLVRVGAEAPPLTSTERIGQVRFGRGTSTAGKGTVWVNVKSGVFHCEGNHWYGKTEQRKLMTEAEARKAGYRPAL